MELPGIGSINPTPALNVPNLLCISHGAVTTAIFFYKCAEVRALWASLLCCRGERLPGDSISESLVSSVFSEHFSEFRSDPISSVKAGVESSSASHAHVGSDPNKGELALSNSVRGASHIPV